MGVDIEVDLERRGFVGRERELALASRVTLAGRWSPVLFLHGPGGIGKSALSRELAGRASELGRQVVLVDGREVAPRADALAIALDRAGLDVGSDQLVILDSFEVIEPIAGFVCERLLPELGERSSLCVAGRNPPNRMWFDPRWVRPLQELALGPLEEAASLTLARRHDVDAAQAARIVTWAKGHPLSITLARPRAQRGRRVATRRGADPRRPCCGNRAQPGRRRR